MEASEIKLELFKKIDGLKGAKLKEVYGLLSNYLNSSKPLNFWDELDTAEKEAIEDGIAQLDRGEGIPHKEVMKKFRQKYSGRI